MAFGYLNTVHRFIPHSLILLASVIVYTAYCQLTMLRLKDLYFEWSSFYNVITYHVYEVHICILKVIEFLMLFFFYLSWFAWSTATCTDGFLGGACARSMAVSFCCLGIIGLYSITMPLWTRSITCVDVRGTCRTRTMVRIDFIWIRCV